MGQKVNPIGLRLGINKTSLSRWFTNRNYAKYLFEDMNIRQYIRSRFRQAGIEKIIIERSAQKILVSIYSARRGVLLGKKGADIGSLKKSLDAFQYGDIQINIQEVRKPEISAVLIADSIAAQIEQRVSHKKAMKTQIDTAMKFGADGIRIICSGRLNGTDIARAEDYRRGRVPLHTLRADIDYAASTALTTYGTIGVKVWVFKGEILDKDSRLTKDA